MQTNYHHPFRNSNCYLCILFAVVYFLSSTIVTASLNNETIEGKFIGASVTQYPEWFKDSFLELEEDINEASERNKRLMLIFYQDGCPYCNALIERNFSQKDIIDKTRENFDIIAINIWGDRTLIDVDGKEYTEKTFAEANKIQFTPTIFFYNESSKMILRLNGYHRPQRFSLELDYIAQHLEEKLSYREFMKQNRPTKRSNKDLIKNSIFNSNTHDYAKKIKQKRKPLAVFFEQKDCPACEKMHSKVLSDNTVRNEATKFDTTQLDMWSKQSIITPSGQKLQAREWAKRLDIKYAPTIILFDENGEEIIRSEAYFKVFHTRAIFNYVNSGAYKLESNFQRYLTELTEHIRSQGMNVDIWRSADDKSVIKDKQKE